MISSRTITAYHLHIPEFFATFFVRSVSCFMRLFALLTFVSISSSSFYPVTVRDPHPQSANPLPGRWSFQFRASDPAYR